MNQRMLNHFDILHNDKFFQFSFIPGTVTFEDVEGALEVFKNEIATLKKNVVEAQKANQEPQPEQVKGE